MQDLQDLDIRIRRLERRLAAWQRAAALGLAIVSLVLIASCANHEPNPGQGIETLRVGKLELVDGDRVLAELAVEEGSPQLRLYDQDGVVRARLWHDQDQTALFLSDAEGHTRVGVAQFAHGGGGVALHGEESRGAAVLYLKDESGSLSFIDEEGKVTKRVAP